MDGLAPQSIKSYLAAIRHTQIEAGLPEPKSLSSCPRIGATTAVAQAGVEDSTIKALGRWSSTPS